MNEFQLTSSSSRYGSNQSQRSCGGCVNLKRYHKIRLSNELINTAHGQNIDNRILFTGRVVSTKMLYQWSIYHQRATHKTRHPRKICHKILIVYVVLFFFFFNNLMKWHHTLYLYSSNQHAKLKFQRKYYYQFKTQKLRL